MPHFIIEFSEDLVGDAAVPALLDAVHLAARETGLFVASHIRTRGHPVRHYRVGDDDAPFVHAELRIKPGRADADKRRLSEAVVEAIVAEAGPCGVVTAEVIDMDAATYAKRDLRPDTDA